MSWTDDRVQILSKLWAEGLSASQIAARLGGVTRNAVIGKVHRLGLSGRATTTRSKAVRRTPRAQKTHRMAGGKSGFAGGAASKLQQGGAEWLNPSPFMQRYQELDIPLDERVALVDLTECQCRWPIGDPQEEDFHFCGKSKEQGLAYCEFHSSIAYNTGSRPRAAKQPAATLVAEQKKTGTS